MDHDDHVELIRAGVSGTTWADLGSGNGAFTLALADLLGAGGSIYSVDRDAEALRTQATAMATRFPAVALRQLAADFTTPLALPELDGLVMANSLHFHRDPAWILPRLVGYLRRGGRFILVEYDADAGNPWVPHPISLARWQRLAPTVGLSHPEEIGRVPSRFLGSIYAALSHAPNPR